MKFIIVIAKCRRRKEVLPHHNGTGARTAFGRPDPRQAKIELLICLLSANPVNVMPPDTKQDSTAPDPKDFVTTHWSMVLSAAGLNSEQAEKALAELCRIYWHPLFAFVQARGYSHHDAEDLVQEFFSRLLKKNYLAAADQSRGRFRSFLLSSLKHFLANDWDWIHALKRGGGKVMIPINLKTGESSLGFEPADTLTADKNFDRSWAMTLLDQVFARLAKEYAETGRSDLFECLRGVLTKEEDSLPYSEIAARRGMTEAAVKMAVQRMRSRYRELLREEIAKTVASPDEVEDEIRHLFLTFGN
jgi:RNA polymerase sigma-70 factor (ECF subfamily)